MDTAPTRDRFLDALTRHQAAFGLSLNDEARCALAEFYEAVIEANPLLHLVAPCPAEEFAVRHVLESLALLEHLPINARIADVGAGGGLPSVPCLVVRRDISAALIESKSKKAEFLRRVAGSLGLRGRAEVLHGQFAEVNRPDVDIVTCRAIDRFAANLPRLIKWSAGCKLAFFGGPELGQELRSKGIEVSEQLLPMSERRYLFISKDRV